MPKNRSIPSEIVRTKDFSFTIDDDEGREPRYSLSLYIPTEDSLARFKNEVLNEIAQYSPDAQLFFVAMLHLATLIPHEDQQRVRKFQIDTLSHIPAIAEVPQLQNKEAIQIFDNLSSDRKYRRGDSLALPDLLRDALYIEPVLKVPLSSPGYLNFRRRMIE